MFLRHLHLHVGDVDSVRNWYVANLGLSVVHEVPGQLIILGNEGDCQLGLEAGVPVSEPERVHLIFRVSDVDSQYAKLVDRVDVDVVQPPEDQPYGHRVAVIRDPAGHTVELYTPLSGERPYD